MQNELIKLHATKKVYTFMAVIFVMELVPVFLTLLSFIKTQDGQSYPSLFFGLLCSLMLPIFLTVLIADMITEEYATGTLGLSLIHPVSRAKLWAAKILTLFFIIILILSYTVLLGYFIGTIFFGWGSGFADQGILYSTKEGIVIIVGSYLSSSIPLLAYCTLVSFLAILFKSSSVLVGSSIGFLLTSNLLGFLAEEVEPYLINSYFKGFAELIFFAKDVPAITFAIQVILTYGVIFYLAGTMLFKKKDLLH